MGEHYVAVAFDKVKWVYEPVPSTAATTNAPDSAVRNMDGTLKTPTGAATTTTTRRANENWYRNPVLQRDQGSVKGHAPVRY